jgi:hypothetical protein
MSRESKSQEVATTTPVPTPAELGIEPFNPLDSVDRPALPRIGISRETCQFLVGEDPVKAVEGHILAITNVRAWWAEEFGTGSTGAPQCFAIGQTRPDVTAEDPQSDNCHTCSHGKFSKNFDAEARPCHQKKRFLFLAEGDALPSLLDVPALGLKACDRWLTTCAARADVGKYLPLWLVRVSLAKRASKTSDYTGTEPVFELVERQDVRAHEIAAAIKAFGGQEQVEQVEQEDVMPF